MSAAEHMLQIKALDNGAHLEFSEFTKKWYVEARLEIGGDGLLQGMTEHSADPEEAVSLYWLRLVGIDNDHYIVSRNPRRHWKWNGAAFQEQTWTYPKDKADA